LVLFFFHADANGKFASKLYLIRRECEEIGLQVLTVEVDLHCTWSSCPL